MYSAFFAAEELRLDERARNRRAVDPHHGVPSPRARFVDVGGEALLARSRLPDEQDRRVCRRDVVGQRQRSSDRRAPIDNRPGTAAALGLPAEVEVLLLEPVAQPLHLIERRLQIRLSLAMHGDVLDRPDEAHMVTPRPGIAQPPRDVAEPSPPADAVPVAVLHRQMVYAAGDELSALLGHVREVVRVDSRQPRFLRDRVVLAGNVEQVPEARVGIRRAAADRPVREPEFSCVRRRDHAFCVFRCPPLGLDAVCHVHRDPEQPRRAVRASPGTHPAHRTIVADDAILLIEDPVATHDGGDAGRHRIPLFRVYQVDEAGPVGRLVPP